jgi:ABC-type molybdate transport system substrate-binding protein
MRSSLKAAVVTAISLLLMPVYAKAQSTIIVQTWGGAFTDALNDVKPDIEKATNTKIEFVTQASSVAGMQRLEAQKAGKACFSRGTDCLVVTTWNILQER